MNRITTARACLAALNERSASVFLLLLLCGDLAFVVMHFISALTPVFSSPLLNIEKDRGYPEMYQYLKFLWIIALLLSLASANRAIHYVAWAVVFAYFLLDDALKVHEWAGRRFAASFTFIPPFGLRLRDLGELAITATVGVLLLPILGWAYRRGSRMFRKVSQDLTLLILVLVFFGVVVDVAHEAVDWGWKARFIVGVIEDGGEMVSVSLALWFTFLTKVRGDKAVCYLGDLVRTVAAGRRT